MTLIVQNKSKFTELAIHANQELVVVFGILHVFQERIHGFFRVHIRQMISQNPHSL